MPKTRVQKETIVTELVEKFARIKSAVFTSISGYTMDDANSIRSKGHDQGVEAIVAKKTLLVKALEKSNLTIAKENLQGSILTTMGYSDEVAPAKLISALIKDRDGIKILGGILEGQFVGAEVIKQLATLPSKEELYAKIVGSINAPVSGFVNALAGNLRNLVYVLNAVKEKKV